MGKSKKRIAVIDAETDPFLFGRIPAPFVWGYYDEEGFKYWNSTADMIEELREQDIIVYAHNGGKFDFHFFLNELEPYSDVMIINGRLAKFKIGLCEFRDSWLIIPQALASYKKTEIDYNMFEKEERNKPENWKLIIDYLRDDCKDLFELLTGFFNEYGRKLTLASTAISVWEKISNTQAPRSDENYYERLKEYYYGGRVECFRAGSLKGPWKVFDINSAYPYAMLLKHPISTNYYRQPGKPLKVFGHMFLKFEGIAKGCLPYRDEKSRELFFPNDDLPRVYSVTGWEFLAAMETKSLTVIKWIHSIKFYGLTDFTKYVNTFYELRKQAKQEEKEATDENVKLEAKRKNIYYKLLLNSCYGKMGSNPKRYSKFNIHTEDDLTLLTSDKSDYEYEFGGTLGQWVLGKRGLTERESRYYNVATAASITGYVRAYLWKAIKSATNVIYCDTDSLICEDVQEGFNLGDDLGQWKFEGEFSRADIGGKKLYCLTDEIKYKVAKKAKMPLDKIKKDGVIKMAAKGGNLTPEEIWSICRGGKINYAPLAPSFSVFREPSFGSRNFKATSKKNLEITLDYESEIEYDEINEDVD